MNPYKRVLDLMDQVPQEKRRLVQTHAWDDKRDCGCIFGTLFPSLDRTYGRGINFFYDYKVALGYELEDPSMGGGELDAFKTWAEGLGLNPLLIYKLQEINDAEDAGDLTAPELWGYVYKRIQEESETWERNTR